jgi:hypothetical protein
VAEGRVPVKLPDIEPAEGSFVGWDTSPSPPPRCYTCGKEGEDSPRLMCHGCGEFFHK